MIDLQLDGKIAIEVRDRTGAGAFNQDRSPDQGFVGTGIRYRSV